MENWSNIQGAYEDAQPLYTYAWALDQAKAMHYGYWDESTSTLPQALNRLNERLAELGKPAEGATILDAGCGVGGTALFLAEQYDAEVLGISLSPVEIEKAREYARAAKLSDEQVTFKVGNYLETPAADASFDQVWAVESVFHCTSRKAFLREMHRILRPGGKLVLADYYEERLKISQQMMRWMREWQKGYEMAPLIRWEDFQRMANRVGFSILEEENASKAVRPSARRLATWGRLGLIYLRLFGWLHKRFFPQYPLNKDQIRSTVSQYKALKSNCWAYRLSVWEKQAD